MSVSFAYCPNEPTLMPCEPVQSRPWTTMLVLFGLKDTQSSVFMMTESWITTRSERYVSHPSELAILVPLRLVALRSILLIRMSVELAMMLNQFGELRIRRFNIVAPFMPSKAKSKGLRILLFVETSFQNASPWPSRRLPSLLRSP